MLFHSSTATQRIIYNIQILFINIPLCTYNNYTPIKKININYEIAAAILKYNCRDNRSQLDEGQILSTINPRVRTRPENFSPAGTPRVSFKDFRPQEQGSNFLIILPWEESFEETRCYSKTTKGAERRRRRDPRQWDIANQPGNSLQTRNPDDSSDCSCALGGSSLGHFFRLRNFSTAKPEEPELSSSFQESLSIFLLIRVLFF